MQEEILTGGSVSKVSRIGQTVYRDTGPWTAAVHAVLCYLREQNFPYSPKVIGIAQDGREMLSFLPGEPMRYPWRYPMFDTSGLMQVVTMLKQLHSATRDIEFPENTQWRGLRAGKRKGQIIRHGDLGPWNTLWNDGKLTGLIDWDFAEPGKALTDLSQLAKYFIPLQKKDTWKQVGYTTSPDYLKRLQVICDTYGNFSPKQVIKGIVELNNSEIIRIKKWAKAGRYPWSVWLDNGEVTQLQDENRWISDTFTDLLV